MFIFETFQKNLKRQLLKFRSLMKNLILFFVSIALLSVPTYAKFRLIHIEESTIEVVNPYPELAMAVTGQPFSYTQRGYEGDYNSYSNQWSELFYSGESFSDTGFAGQNVTLSPRRLIRGKEQVAIFVRWTDCCGRVQGTASVVIWPGSCRGAFHVSVYPQIGQYDRRFPNVR